MSGFTEVHSAWATHRGERHALATIVRTTGSTYRKAGARMLVSSTGRTVGLLSGGCLEQEIAGRGLEVIRTGRPTLTSFDTRRLLGCNGRIEVLLEAVAEERPDHFLAVAAACHAARQPLVGTTIFAAEAATHADLGSFALLSGDGVAGLDRQFPADLERDGRGALGSDRAMAASYTWPGGRVEALLHGIPPPIRLLIFGAGPDVTPLAQWGCQLKWQTVVLAHPSQDPPPVPERCSVFAATAEELPGLLVADARTAAVVMTHNFGRDLSCLATLLRLPLPYVGLLGPRGRRAQLLAELAGIDALPNPDDLQRLHSPAGLDLGADGPEEIALSIVAEIKAVMAGRSATPLGLRRAAVHA